MAELMGEGNYSNCKLLEAVFADSDYGPQWVLTFNVDGVKRTCYLSTNEDKEIKDGKNALQLTVETLNSMGFNGNVEDPQFSPEVYDQGIELYCKHSQNKNGETKERWYVSSGFKQTPASRDAANNFKTRWKAMSGQNPRPAAARPTPAPARPAAAPVRAPSRPTNTQRPLVTANNADEAFSKIQEKVPDITGDRFYSLIDGYSADNNKAEAAFTSQDWSKIVEIGTLPEAPFG